LNLVYPQGTHDETGNPDGTQSAFGVDFAGDLANVSLQSYIEKMESDDLDERIRQKIQRQYTAELKRLKEEKEELKLECYGLKKSMGYAPEELHEFESWRDQIGGGGTIKF
jgi:hypothetical protein